MKKFLFILTFLTVTLLCTSVAFAAHPCDACGSGNTTLAGSGAWCHWDCEECGYRTSRNHNPNSYNSGLVPDSCSGTCRWCGASAVYSSHTFTTWFPTGDATCLTDGTETCRCDNVQCSAVKTRPAPGSALGHNYEKFVTEPTCETSGWTDHICSRCGDMFTNQATKRLGHQWSPFTNNGDGTHSASCTRRYCKTAVTAACSPVTNIVGGSEVTLCRLCGYRFSGEGSMEATKHASVKMDVSGLPGDLIVLVDAAPFEFPLNTDAFYMFVTSLQKDGQEVPFSGRIEIVVNLNQHPFSMPDSIFFEMAPSELKARAFKIVRVEMEQVNGEWKEVWHECPFTLKEGILTFETEKMGTFLMVLNIAEAPSVG